MQCNNVKKKCNCEFNVKTVGLCDVSRLNIDGTNRENLNWTEISVPEILCIPEAKPDIENIDQIYANIALDNVKLIETPFAYKQYILYDFFISLEGITGELPGLITALTTAEQALIVPLNTTLTNALNSLAVALGPLSGIAGVPALITTVNAAVTTVNTLVNNLNNSILLITDAANKLLAAIAADPISADVVCSAIQILINAVNALQVLLLSIIPLLTGIVSTLTAAAAAIGNVLVTAAVTAATTIINTLITVTLPPLITAVSDQIENILGLLATVDCKNSSAFVLIGNSEGTCLSGRKIILEGRLKQKVVYTAEVLEQSVHSAHYEVPFISYIVAYANFENAVYTENIQVYNPETGMAMSINGFLQTDGSNITVNLDEEFAVQTCIEDIYVYQLSKREIFKNVTVFFKAIPKVICE